jgi:hypothetical protein
MDEAVAARRARVTRTRRAREVGFIAMGEW